VKLRAYLRLVVALGAAIVAQSIWSSVRMPHPLAWLVFAALAFVTGSFKLNFASVSASIFVSDTFFIAIAVMFGPGPATVAIAMDSLILSLRKRDPIRRVAFNVAACALSLWGGAQVCFQLARVAPLADSQVAVGVLAVPLLVLAVVYFALNSGLTAVAVGLDSGQSPIQIWKRHFMWLSIGYLASASAAFCLILLVQQVSLAAAIMVLPLLAVFYVTLRASFGRLEDAQRHLGELDRLYLSTVETLAMAIDAKDDVTHSHVRRVQAYAVGLARALGVADEQDIKAIEAAALLHDTGKLAVPEHILNKPGKLTASEFEKMKLHVDVGADILSLVDFPYPVVPIVRAHHESWDGSGYPRGLSGEDIPIGARILSVVDCFDALTSDRPYRRRMTEQAALDILRERRGNMYDPRVVDMFIAVYQNIPLEQADAPAQREVMRRIAESRSETPAKPEIPLVRPAPGASDDVLAFVSLARLAAGDGTIADILALSSNLIRDIVPGATATWYLPDPAVDRLAVVDAFGPAANVLQGATVGIGQRLTGWVAASRQSIVNSDAALDLDARAQTATPALTSCMSVPLLTGGALAGVLTLYASTPDLFDEHRCRLIEMIAPHIAGALNAAASAPVLAKEPVRAADKPAEPHRGPNRALVH
jgi:putative nucleotidyltransferase with HDIG domain